MTLFKKGLRRLEGNYLGSGVNKQTRVRKKTKMNYLEGPISHRNRRERRRRGGLMQGSCFEANLLLFPFPRISLTPAKNLIFTL